MTTDDNFLDFKCPYCSDGVSFPGDAAGLAQECPNCGETVIVPEDGSAVGGKPPLPVTGQRLMLRRLQASDWRDLLELMSDEELFVDTEGRALSEEEVIRWLESDSHVKLTTPNQPFYLGIEVRDGSKLIGYLSLKFLDPQRLQAALHILVGRSHQRKGFAAESIALLLGFCFQGIRLHRVTAACSSRNVAACRLLEKVRMRREGEFLKDHQLDGEWINTVRYALLEEEYR